MTETRPGVHAEMYLAAIRHELADVPWRRRDDLLATVSERLGELPDTAVPARELGPASDYARDLRESAGLPPQRRTPLTLFRATRRRTKVVSFAGVIVLGIAVATIIAVPRYQPITADVISGAGTARPVNDRLATGVDYSVFQPGRTIVSAIQIENHGWTTVSVDGVAIPAAPDGPLLLQSLHASSTSAMFTSAPPAATVTRVSIRPGKSVYLFVVMKMGRFTLGKGATVVVDQPALRVRVLGVHHLVTVTGDKIGLVSP